MADITLSAGVRQNLLSLQNTSDLMSQTQNRLATGKEVNSALDNPSNFFTSQSLSSRANEMSSLMDAMANGVKTLEAADNGLTAITKTLESMQSTLRQARQDKSFQTESYSVDSDTIEGGAAGSRTISFSGGALGTGETVDINLTDAYAGSITGDTYTAPAAASGPDAITGDAWSDYDHGTNGDLSFDIQGNNDASAITVTIDDTGVGDASAVTIDEAVSQINEDLAAGGSTVRAREGSGGELELYETDAANVGDASSITVTANADTATLGLTSDGSTDAESTGSDAEQITFSINDTDVTLNGDDHSTAAEAATAINAALQADGAAEGLSASADGDSLVIAGPADGSGITIAGADADDAFGASGSRTTDQWGVEGNSNGTTKSVDDLVSEINGLTSLDGKIRASNDNGKLRIENQSTQELNVDGADSSGALDGTSSGTANIDGNSVRAGLADQFNELKDQLDKLSDDASYNGVNLLRGDNLKITFNETGTSTIDIQTENGETINSANLGLSSIEAADLDSDSNIDSTIASLKGAMDEISSQSSTFGSNLSIVENRQDFTKNMVNTLETGADNLVLADMNEEAANMMALQTRQQLSSSALSLASQSDQNVLQLIR